MLNKRRALITGISGQDGSYLAELLLSKDYEVHGIVRRSYIEDPDRKLWRIKDIQNEITLHSMSIESYASVFNVIRLVRPHECYHLAAQSFVNSTLGDELATINVNINSTHNIVSAIRESAPYCKFYFAGSSEMFGDTNECPQHETSVFMPRTAYGISKLSGYHIIRNYRFRGELFASAGFLYNHESPRRGFEFVTRKITSHVAKIKYNQVDNLILGNLDAQRDWGHAREYVTAMWLMLQQEVAADYVIATGKLHTIRNILEIAFEHVGLAYQDYVTSDVKFFRAPEKVSLAGDNSKALRELGWEPKIEFSDIIKEMVDADLKVVRNEMNKA